MKGSIEMKNLKIYGSDSVPSFDQFKPCVTEWRSNPHGQLFETRGRSARNISPGPGRVTGGTSRSETQTPDVHRPQQPREQGSVELVAAAHAAGRLKIDDQGVPRPIDVHRRAAADHR
jgi:hypothetical protein